MRETLQYILDQVNHWLKFAEAKNGTLIALLGASLLGIINLINEYNFSEIMNLFIINYLIFSSLSLIVAIVSFIPKTSIPWLSKGKVKKSDNLYYYGDLKKYTPNVLLEKLFSNKDFSRSEENLAAQIIINSKIAYDKFIFFKISVWLLFTAILTPILSIFLFVLVIKYT